MPRTSTAAFKAARAASAGHFCYLTKVGPLPVSGDYLRFTSHGYDLVYDDQSGDGDQTFYARTGTELSNLSSDIDLSVDNGEASTLTEIPTYPNTGITDAMIDAKALDGVEYVVYEVNWKDLTAAMGHEVQGSGPIGEVRKHRSGLITFELRSWTQYLQQNSVVELDSLTCRVKRFGSQVGEERFPCMKDITAMWVNAVAVTSVGSETVREFTAGLLLQASGFFAPGLVEWVSGDNAGTSQEVEDFDAGGVISLRFVTTYPIQAGDTFNIRPDCTRKWSGANSCDTHSNRPWFRGEPFIPVSDTVALSIPYAS